MYFVMIIDAPEIDIKSMDKNRKSDNRCIIDVLLNDAPMIDGIINVSMAENRCSDNRCLIVIRNR